MSALLEKPVTREKQTLPRPTTARKQPTKSDVKPHIHLGVRIITKKRSNLGRVVLMKCAIFTVTLGLAYMASSFGGQLLLEGARQERIEAKRRAHEAKEAETILTAKLDKIVSAGGIEEWAMNHGFIAPESQIQPKSKTRGLVASR